MNITLETAKETVVRTGRYIKTNAKKLSGSIKEANEDMKANIRDIREAIHDCREAGKVHKAGVTDDAVLEQLGPATKGLEDYAKANNINIIFHTPQKPAEAGSTRFERPLSITAYKNGLVNSYTTSRTIDGDVNHVSKVIIPPKGKDGAAEVEDTFLRRVYRNVQEMAQEINQKRKQDFEDTFIGGSLSEAKEEIKASHEQIRSDVKDFFSSMNPFKKS